MFELLAPGVGVGTPAPPGFRPLGSVPLLVLVGPTGAGKSTVLAGLVAGGECRALPDRRELTLRGIIAPLQREDGEVPHDLPRAARVPYVARFATQHPGGLSEVLAALWVAPGDGPAGWAFDGLRGPAELAWAAAALPGARFLACVATAATRLQRLVGRADPHDGFLASSGAAAPSGGGAAEAQIATAQRIVAQDEQLHNPDAGLATLRARAPGRVLAVDTDVWAPAQAVGLARAWLAWSGAQGERERRGDAPVASGRAT